MFCMNCGTKLPDGARFCFSCGAKIPVAGETQVVPNSQADSKIGGKVETKTNTPVETIEEPIKFVIHGKEFSVDGSYRNYIAERNRFYKAYYSYTDKIISEQFDTYKEYIDSDPDKCVEILSNLGNRVINWGLDAGINFLIEHSIFDVSKTVLSNECAEQMQGFYSAYSRFEEGYLSIVATEEQMEEYRKLKHGSRGRWQGGGFGVAGAVKGAAVAGVMNLGGTILSSIGTAITGAIDNSMIRKEKREFLNKRNWFGDCFGGLLSDISLIFQNTYFLLCQKTNYKMPPLNLKKADIYFENIQQATTQQQVISITLMGLKEYPYHRWAHAKLIENLPFLDMDAIQLIEYFQPEGFWKAWYRTYAARIQKEYNRLPEDDYKQLDEKIAYLQDKIDVIIRERERSAFVEGFATRYLENWKKLCEELKIRRRTAEDGTIFSSIEELEVFQSESEKFNSFINQAADVASIFEERTVWKNAQLAGFNSEVLLAQIEDRLQAIQEKQKLIAVLYGLVDVAQTEEEIYKRYEEIITSTHSTFEQIEIWRKAKTEINFSSWIMQKVDTRIQEINQAQYSQAKLVEKKLKTYLEEAKRYSTPLEILSFWRVILLDIEGDIPEEVKTTIQECIDDAAQKYSGNRKTVITNGLEEVSEEELIGMMSIIARQYQKNDAWPIYVAGTEEFAKRSINAYKKIGGNNPDEVPLFLLDMTILGSGKSGYVLTDRRLYKAGTSYGSNSIPWQNISTFECSDGQHIDAVVSFGEKIRIDGNTVESIIANTLLLLRKCQKVMNTYRLKN